MIQFKNCEIGYTNKTIFKEINLAFREKTVTAILGQNGCGKTTLLSTIFDIKRLKSGEITVNNKNIKHIPIKKLASYISFVPQIQRSAFDFLVKDIILMGRNPYMGFNPRNEDIIKVEDTLEKLEISHLINKNYSQISGGERQMVNIARAVVQDTPTILMDEPTSYLDLKNQSKVMNLIKRLNQENGKTIIMTLHEPSQALIFCDEVVFVENGNIFCGKSKEVITPETIKRIYGVDAKMVTIETNSYIIPLI